MLLLQVPLEPAVGASGWAPDKILQGVGGKDRRMKPLGADHLTEVTSAASAVFKPALYCH